MFCKTYWKQKIYYYEKKFHVGQGDMPEEIISLLYLILRVNAIFLLCKKLRDWFGIKLNNLDLSTRGFVDIYLNSCFAKFVLTVLYSLGILPLMFGREGWSTSRTFLVVWSISGTKFEIFLVQFWEQKGGVTSCILYIYIYKFSVLETAELANHPKYGITLPVAVPVSPSSHANCP